MPNGDLAHLLMFGSLGAFSLLGMLAIDTRNQRRLGTAKWNYLSRNTSLVPLVGLAGGRWRPSFNPGYLVRLIFATSLYIGFLALHQPIIGVSPFPLF